MGRYEDLIASEQELFNAIVSYTASTAEQDAFLGYLPDITNAWALILDGSDWEGDFCTRFPILNYRIVGRFAEQETAYNFIYLIQQWWKSQQTEESWYLENSQRLLFGEFNAPEQGWVKLYKQKRNTSHWHVDIDFSIEFLAEALWQEYSSSSSSSSLEYSSSSSSSLQYSESSQSSSSELYSESSSSSSELFSESSSSEPVGNDWLTDAHIWLDADQTPMVNTIDGSWAKNGTIYWGTFGSGSSAIVGWITYKRRYESLKDENTNYGTNWAINFRFKNTYLDQAYNSAGRPMMHRGNPASTNGAFFISNQLNGAGTSTSTEIRIRAGGVTTSYHMDWGALYSNFNWYNLTIASGDGDTRLFINGTKVFTQGNNIDIPSSTQPTYIGINGAVISASFDVSGFRHFSWLNYKPTDDEVINTIHPAMATYGP